MADVFISFARPDRQLVELTAEALVAEGFSVWWDQALHFDPGWESRNASELQAAKCVLVLWTPLSVTRAIVRKEGDAALAVGKLVQASFNGAASPLGARGQHDLTGWLGDAQDQRWRSVVDVLRATIESWPERQAQAKADAERQAREDQERRTWEKAEAERLAREQAERRTREKAEAERLAREHAEREAREKAEADRLAALAAERAAREKANAELWAQQESERQAREKAEAERRALEQAQLRARDAERQTHDEIIIRRPLEQEERWAPQREPERRGREDIARLAREEQERRAREKEAERQAREDAERLRHASEPEVRRVYAPLDQERRVPWGVLTGGVILLAAAAPLVIGLRAPPPSPPPPPPPVEVAPEVTGPPPGSLAWSAEGAWRLETERAEDGPLHRLEVIETLGLDKADSVLELAPGAGAWTALLAPTVAAHEGRYVAALTSAEAGDAAGALGEQFKARFADDALFGRIETPTLGPAMPPLAAPESITAAFTFDDVATWMALGYAEKAFADAYAALAPGGSLGVIQPRGAPWGAQDPGAATGYVQTAYVVRLAEEAGFVLEASSELLANPADSRDHPFGVWTLAPYNLTAPLGDPPDPAFDRSVYDQIGQPDRMMLLFRKPSPDSGEGASGAPRLNPRKTDSADAGP
jgi:predicted methyltransferase